LLQISVQSVDTVTGMNEYGRRGIFGQRMDNLQCFTCKLFSSTEHQFLLSQQSYYLHFDAMMDGVGLVLYFLCFGILLVARLGLMVKLRINARHEVTD